MTVNYAYRLRRRLYNQVRDTSILAGNSSIDLRGYKRGRATLNSTIRQESLDIMKIVLILSITLALIYSVNAYVVIRRVTEDPTGGYLDRTDPLVQYMYPEWKKGKQVPSGGDTESQSLVSRIMLQNLERQLELASRPRFGKRSIDEIKPHLNVASDHHP